MIVGQQVVAHSNQDGKGQVGRVVCWLTAAMGICVAVIRFDDGNYGQRKLEDITDYEKWS